MNSDYVAINIADLKALIEKEHAAHEPCPSFLCGHNLCKTLHEAIEDGRRYTMAEVENDDD